MDFHFNNRIEIEAAEWNSKEERLRKLFKSSPSIEKSLAKEKLKWCERMLIKYEKNKHSEDRSALQLIKNERSDLIIQVYPQRSAQLFYRFMNFLILEKLNSKMQIKENLKDNKLLDKILAEAGFKGSFAKVKRYMKLGQPNFSVPVSYYVNQGERIDHYLRFVKNDRGNYVFDGFNSRLHNQSNLSEVREHYISAVEGDFFNKEQIYNLLSGRAIQCEDCWKQLDLNDKDADGNYKLKEFPECYGYSIDRSLSQLSLKISNELEFSCLVKALKEGERVQALLKREGSEKTIFIEADPEYKSFKIYDENLKGLKAVEKLTETKNQTSKLQNDEGESHTIKRNKIKGKSKVV